MQRRAARAAQRSKLLNDKNLESIDTTGFLTLLLYHTSAADTIFFVQFQKKKGNRQM